MELTVPLRVPFLDLRRHYQAQKGELDRAVQEVLESGWFILGPKVATFEEAFASYLGVPFAIGVGSGTEALHLALLACGIGPGDEVITVANTAVATVNAIAAAGARPVFVDIDPQTYTMDVVGLSEALSPRTRALLPVHLYGHPAAIAPLLAFAQAHGLRLIEDACQAHGATYEGKRVGTLGDLGCFSFYPTKNLGAYGDAGTVVTRDEGLAQRVRLLRNHGQESRYVHRLRGFTSRLDELQAALLLVQLAHLEEGNARRRLRARRYQDLLADLSPQEGCPEGLVLPGERPGSRHVFHLYVVRTPFRDDLQSYLHREGIETLIHYPIPVHLQEAYADLGLGPGALPQSERCAREILSLPLYPELTEAEVEAVAEAIRGFLRDRG